MIMNSEIKISPEEPNVNPLSARRFPCTFGTCRVQKSGTLTDQRELTWDELKVILTDHKEGEKDGPCLIPAIFREPKRQKQYADEIWMVGYDFDCGYTADEIKAKLEEEGLAAIGYSTNSHLKTTTVVTKKQFEETGRDSELCLFQVKKYQSDVCAGARAIEENNENVTIEHNPCSKIRVVMPLARPWRAADYDSQETANSDWTEHYKAGARFLGFVFDETCTDSSRLLFLPRHKPGCEFETFVTEGADFDIWNLPKLEKEIPIAPLPKQTKPLIIDPNEDIIGAFNRNHSIKDLLEKHGYKKKGDKYLAPTSNSGMPGVSILDGRVYSHHESDPLSSPEKHSHDAFGVYSILEHAGDTKEAVKAAAGLLGMEPKKAGNGNGECPPVEWEPELLQESPEPTEDKDIVTVVNCRDLCAMQFTDRPIIEGLLGEKESLIIVGQSGIMKSSCAYNIALRAGASSNEDSPIHLFDKFGISRRYTSLFIQSENTAAATQKRIANIIDAAPRLESGLEQVYFASIRNDIRLSGPLTEPKFQAGILSLLDKTHADLLFLDPLISYHAADENDNAAMRRTLDCLTAICDKANVASCVVHHAGKTGVDNSVFAGRGASAIGDWAGNILVLSPGPELRKEDGSRRFIVEVSHRKSRNYETVEPFFLERINGALLVPIHPQQLNPERMKRIKTVVQILEEAGGYIDHKELLVKKVMTRINKSRGSAQNAINAACEDNLIRIVPLEKKGHGYRLPDYEIAEDDD
jgi:hypothetical protein